VTGAPAALVTLTHMFEHCEPTHQSLFLPLAAVMRNVILRAHSTGASDPDASTAWPPVPAEPPRPPAPPEPDVVLALVALVDDDVTVAVVPAPAEPPDASGPTVSGEKSVPPQASPKRPIAIKKVRKRTMVPSNEVRSRIVPRNVF
jgi:hypothetical protein